MGGLSLTTLHNISYNLSPGMLCSVPAIVHITDAWVEPLELYPLTQHAASSVSRFQPATDQNARVPLRAPVL